jgi:hypothetical protein
MMVQTGDSVNCGLMNTKFCIKWNFFGLFILFWHCHGVGHTAKEKPLFGAINLDLSES